MRLTCKKCKDELITEEDVSFAVLEFVIKHLIKCYDFFEYEK